METDNYSIKPCVNGFIVEVCYYGKDSREVFNYEYKKYVYTDWKAVTDFIISNPITVN